MVSRQSQTVSPFSGRSLQPGGCLVGRIGYGVLPITPLHTLRPGLAYSILVIRIIGPRWAL